MPNADDQRDDVLRMGAEHTTAAAAASHGSKASGASQEALSTPFGSEVVGRTISLCRSRGAWANASIQAFDAATAKHTLCMEGGEIRVVSLGSCKFKWSSRPGPRDPPNPSWASAPRAQAAIGCRVRVFWPAMGRYYTGVVKSYDPVTGMHRVDYSDGDSAEHNMRHEATLWLEQGVGSPAKHTAHNGSRCEQRALPCVAVACRVAWHAVLDSGKWHVCDAVARV